MFGLPFFNFGGFGDGLLGLLPIYAIFFGINLVIQLLSGGLTNLFPTNTTT